MHSQINCALNSLESNTWWIYNEITHLKPIFPKVTHLVINHGSPPLQLYQETMQNVKNTVKRWVKIDRNVLVDQNSSSRTSRHRTPISAFKNTNFSATRMERFSFLIWSGSNKIGWKFKK